MIYLFEHPETREVKEVFQRITEDHFYVDESGVKWKRVYTPTNFSVDGRVNAFSSKEFVEKTAKEGMSVGDMWDLSRELSDKREKSAGKDPVKERYVEDYSKLRKGKRPRSEWDEH
jgi:hypothetical protein